MERPLKTVHIHIHEIAMYKTYLLFIEYPLKTYIGLHSYPREVETTDCDSVLF